MAGESRRTGQGRAGAEILDGGISQTAGTPRRRFHLALAEQGRRTGRQPDPAAYPRAAEIKTSSGAHIVGREDTARQPEPWEDRARRLHPAGLHAFVAGRGGGA